MWSGGEFDLVWVGSDLEVWLWVWRFGSNLVAFVKLEAVVRVVFVERFDLVWVGSDLEVWLWVQWFGSDLGAFVELELKLRAQLELKPG